MLVIYFLQYNVGLNHLFLPLVFFSVEQPKIKFNEKVVITIDIMNKFEKYEFLIESEINVSMCFKINF